MLAIVIGDRTGGAGTLDAVERWRRLIGHDGYVVVRMRIATPAEGGRSRTIQSGYRAQWWLVEAAGESWLGEGPLDLAVGRRSMKPGAAGQVRLHPMQPAHWREVRVGAVLHMRERVGQTLGIAQVTEIVDVPDDAPLRLDRVRQRPGRVLLRAERWPHRVIRRVLALVPGLRLRGSRR